MSVDIADVLGQATLARRSVDVCIRGDLAGRLEAAKARWLAAIEHDRNHNAPATAAAVYDEILDLEAEADKATVTFIVQAIGSTAWRRLVAEHPPPADDLDGWRWNIETLPPAALALCCVEPEMNEDQANELADRLSNGQWQKLFGAVLAVNMGDDIVPKLATGTDAPVTTEPSLTTAAPEESLTRSS